MSFHLLNNENDIYPLFEEKKALLKERSVNISIKGLNLSDEDLSRIESQIQQMVTTEIVRHEQTRIQEIRKIEHKSIRNKNTILVSLTGLNLPNENKKFLESQIQQMVSEMRQNEGEGGGEGGGGEGGGGGSSCICAGGIPGETISLDGINPLPQPSPGRNDIITAVFFPKSGDALRMVVEDGAQFGLDRNQMLIGLASSVDWAKEIMAWSICRERLSSVYQGRANSTPNWMLISNGCFQADTIVFRKPMFLGIWVDVANFDLVQFWNVLGGKKVTFTWVVD